MAPARAAPAGAGADPLLDHRMNTFSQAQWDSMGKRSFESKMIALIRANHPRESGQVADDVLKGEIHRQVARAARHEMTDEQSVATYVYAAWLLGPAFDERIPSLRQILGSAEMSPLAKANALDNFLVTVFHALDSGRSGGWIDENSQFQDKGTFVAPDDVPYEMRALPAGTDLKPLSTYEVLKPISQVPSGPAAPWFGQPGGGMQHELPMSINKLLEGGYIRVIDRVIPG